jgi:hypothetical protein
VHHCITKYFKHTRENALVQIDRIKNALPSNAQAVEVGIYPGKMGKVFLML